MGARRDWRSWAELRPRDDIYLRADDRDGNIEEANYRVETDRSCLGIHSTIPYIIVQDTEYERGGVSLVVSSWVRCQALANRLECMPNRCKKPWSWQIEMCLQQRLQRLLVLKRNTSEITTTA